MQEAVRYFLMLLFFSDEAQYRGLTDNVSMFYDQFVGNMDDMSNFQEECFVQEVHTGMEAIKSQAANSS